MRASEFQKNHFQKNGNYGGRGEEKEKLVRHGVVWYKLITKTVWYASDRSFPSFRNFFYFSNLRTSQRRKVRCPHLAALGGGRLESKFNREGRLESKWCTQAWCLCSLDHPLCTTLLVSPHHIFLFARHGVHLFPRLVRGAGHLRNVAKYAAPQGAGPPQQQGAIRNVLPAHTVSNNFVNNMHPVSLPILACLRE